MWRKVMKRLLVVMFFAATAFAQNPPPGLPAACGPKNVIFKVKLDESQHTLAQPEPGKARVYFIQNAGQANIGLDGAWVGANWGDSYFAMSMEPGEHHLCAYVTWGSEGLRLLHFTAEAGKVYYFSLRAVDTRSAQNLLFFDPVDSDQARYQIATYPLSISTPKTPRK